MKIRIADRVFVALAGILLLVLCGCVIAQSFFGVPVLETVQAMLSGKTAVVWLPYILCAVLLVLGGYCIALLFRRRRGKKGFVLQETDGGELSIALSAMDGLVCQCVAVHDEMQLLESKIAAAGDGVAVDLRVALANGVSVPLAVDALQKQIRQYVTSCSGVTVHEVRVQVDSMDNHPVETPYAVPAMLQSAVPAPMLMQGDEAAEEEKPMHQRIFSQPEEQEIPATEEVCEETDTEAADGCESIEAAEEVDEASEGDTEAVLGEDAAEEQPEDETVAEESAEETEESAEETEENEPAEECTEPLTEEVNDEVAE